MRRALRLLVSQTPFLLVETSKAVCLTFPLHLQRAAPYGSKSRGRGGGSRFGGRDFRRDGGGGGGG